ncbi:MAG: hypothetical protein IJT11_06750, partial [Bacteroidaceae bacterium]|nr:hypothetical protein [Bacteroidaceae bacterium]
AASASRPSHQHLSSRGRVPERLGAVGGVKKPTASPDPSKGIASPDPSKGGEKGWGTATRTL